ncbi:MAG: hypothetical protein CW338_03245 [Clostridiales bacterium]|nr:hypothetical protein [Clostridiales bacterium]
MQHKRLNRDGWGFQFYPYYQMRLDEDFFHGTACLIKLTDGEAQKWQMSTAGTVQVTGEGVTWLELIPDGTNRVITVMYFPEGTRDPERKHYPRPADKRYQPSIWYVDVSDGIEYDEYGVVTYIDKYLDVIFSPEGDIKVDDRDELDAAYAAGELSRKQYEDALAEGERILKELCGNIRKTDKWCAAVRAVMEEKIAAGEGVVKCREVLEAEKMLEDAKGYVRGVFQNDFSGHDFYHTLRVFRMADRIARQEKANRLIVSLAALLHDVDDRKLSPATHEKKDRAVGFLKEHRVPEDVIERICRIIDEVSFNGTDSVVPSTVEGKCVQDADRLDALGAVGIARTFAYGGSHGRDIYDPDIPPAENMTGEEYRGHIAPSVNHFYEKLFLLKDMMNTDTGRRIAEGRDAFMRSYIDEFMLEWDGKDA